MDNPLNNKKRRRTTKVDYIKSNKESNLLVQSPRKRPASSTNNKKNKKKEFFIVPNSNDGINITQLRTRFNFFEPANNLLSTISRMMCHNFISFRHKVKETTSTATTRE